MNYPRYEIKFSLAYDYYEFVSLGKKGLITKGIAFYQDEENPFDYYCVLGDLREDLSLDTLVITDNGDMEKVLSTVAAVTIIFLNQYPDCQVIIKGSNKTRTRLYRMAINMNYEILVADFEIFGIYEHEELTENFEKGSVKDYDSFLIKRKK